ncbi:MAG: ABC transporter ATP-binding protein [Planctomycetes bacterium]|nr:ABC transporter ATP-binding protein [Planctomycetota bacterium]MCW8134562.1 ABC transporter ATP-binding protein [Planctomycetota bacterium]
MPAIEFSGLSKTFRDFFGRRSVQALDGLSLSVDKGQVFGLLGPNGSGKSTAFKIAAGLIRPNAGSVSINGHRPGTMAARRATGYLSEDSTLLPFLNARETLRLHGALAGLTRTQAAATADELLDRVGLKDAAKRRVKGFSKGMQRRLGVATVLVGDPDVFILDEPTSGLDPLGAVQMKELIAGLRDQGKAILISSHLLGELENVCDRVAFINHGRLLSEGTLEELLRETETHELRVSPPDKAAIAELEALAKQMGLNVISSRSPMRTLEAFYLRMLKHGDKS